MTELWLDREAQIEEADQYDYVTDVVLDVLDSLGDEDYSWADGMMVYPPTSINP